LEGKELVVAASAMTKANFARHFTKRHHEYLAGQVRLPGNISAAVESAYRAYHRRIHQLGNLEHEHEQDD